MALITSAATGNFSAGATWTGGVVPGVGDEARASTGHTITIDVNTTCDEVSNAGTGIFTLASGVTLTANVTTKSTTTSRICLKFTAASPAVGTIVGNCTGGTVSLGHAVDNTSTGTLNITGNCTGGSSSSFGARNFSTGIVNITGDCTAGSGSVAIGIQNTSTGIVNVTGNAFGANGGSSAGVWNSLAGILTLTGNVTGGSVSTSYGANNTGAGTLTITGIATGGTVGVGVLNSSTGTVNLGRAKGNAYGPGNTSGLSAAVGANNTVIGVIEIQGLIYGDYGMSPTSGTGFKLKKATTNIATFTFVDAGAAKTLVDSTTGQMPAATDVRSGVSYASGALTGTCAVPAAASVGFGVPVDATTGTAVVSVSDVANAVWTAASRTITEGGITAADVWSHATRTITGGTVDTLTNAPTVPSASAIAGQVRTELEPELTKVSALNTERLANVATTNIVGTLLAQAHS